MKKIIINFFVILTGFHLQIHIVKNSVMKKDLSFNIAENSS